MSTRKKPIKNLPSNEKQFCEPIKERYFLFLVVLKTRTKKKQKCRKVESPHGGNNSQQI